MQYAYCQLIKIIKNENKNNQNEMSSRVDLRIAVMDICSFILKERELFLLVLSKRYFQVKETNLKNIEYSCMAHKHDVIELLEESIGLIKQIFLEDTVYRVRMCEIKRGYSEIKKLKSILDQLENYLNLIQYSLSVNKQEIRKYTATLNLFFLQIECHIGFIV